MRVNSQKGWPGARRPSIYGATSGANIRGTSFVGRFVLEYHPVPGGGAEGDRWAQVARAAAVSPPRRVGLRERLARS